MNSDIHVIWNAWFSFFSCVMSTLCWDLRFVAFIHPVLLKTHFVSDSLSHRLLFLTLHLVSVEFPNPACESWRPWTPNLSRVQSGSGCWIPSDRPTPKWRPEPEWQSLVSRMLELVWLRNNMKNTKWKKLAWKTGTEPLPTGTNADKHLEVQCKFTIDFLPNPGKKLWADEKRRCAQKVGHASKHSRFPPSSVPLLSCMWHLYVAIPLLSSNLRLNSMPDTAVQSAGI